MKSYNQVIDRHTGENHHNTLTLVSYKKLKGGWIKQEEKAISLDDQTSDEIGILEEFIKNFRANTRKEKKDYGIIERKDFEKFEKIVNSEIGDIINEILEDSENYNRIVQQGGLPLLKDVIEFTFKQENSMAIVEKLQELDLESLQEVTTVAGLSQINKILEIWKDNSDNCNEEFWQKTISSFSWIVSQIFSTPVILYAEKAYVGGKFLDNSGGNIIDFIYKNNLTANVSLIEIKTPCTEIIGKPYRQTYAMSDEVSGAINQILNYKYKIQQHFLSISASARNGENFEVINPKILLITGCISNSFGGDKSKLEAFELYRQNLKDVIIITFDELFEKVSILKSILQGGK